MKIHISCCPAHPNEVGKQNLSGCYCRVTREATLSELLYEFADEAERMPQGSDYGRQLLDAIRTAYADPDREAQGPPEIPHPREVRRRSLERW